MDAQWKPIPGWPYEVSDMGGVRRTEPYNSTATHRMLKPFGGKYGRVTLHADKKQRQVSVHRLVALAFVPGHARGLQVNHKNGDKSDNRASNLEWVTPSQNQIHSSMVLGNREAFGRSGRLCRKLSDQDAVDAVSMYAAGCSQGEVARRFGVNQSTISRLVRGISYLTALGHMEA